MLESFMLLQLLLDLGLGIATSAKQVFFGII